MRIDTTLYKNAAQFQNLVAALPNAKEHYGARQAIEWSYPVFVDGSRLGIQAVCCSGYGVI